MDSEITATSVRIGDDAVTSDRVLVAKGAISAESLMAWLKIMALPNDMICVELDYTRNGKSYTISCKNHWPMELSLLNEMVTVPAQALNNIVHLQIRRFGRLGDMAFFKEVGPPAWRFPRLTGHKRPMRMMFGVGWRMTAYYMVWYKHKTKTTTAAQ